MTILESQCLNFRSLRCENSNFRIKQGGGSVSYLVKDGAVRLLKYEFASTVACLFQTKNIVPLMVHVVTRVILFSTE
jgi:hypothetical protein